MSAFLTNVFFQNQPFSEPSHLTLLDAWVLTPDKYSANSEPAPEPNTANPEPAPEPAPESAAYIVSPRRGDQLFWCIFAAALGEAELLVGGTTANREIDEKQKVVESLRKCPKSLKASSAKTSLVATREIMSDLMTGARTTPDSAVAVCAHYGVRVLIVSDRSRAYLDVDPDPSSGNTDAHIVRLSADGAYSVEIDPPAARCADVRAAGVRAESLARPLRGAASYTLAELTELATRVGAYPATATKPKKADIYAALAEACAWPAQR